MQFMKKHIEVINLRKIQQHMPRLPLMELIASKPDTTVFQESHAEIYFDQDADRP